MMAGHILYYAALDADTRYTDAIYLHAGSPGSRKTRWTLTVEDEVNPHIAAAYAAKVRADGQWLDFMAASRAEVLS